MLRMQRGGPERLSFKVDKITKNRIDPLQADKLFSPPKDFYEIQAPQF